MEDREAGKVEDREAGKVEELYELTVVAMLQMIAVIVPVKGGVDPPLSVNVLFVGEFGNTEQSGNLLGPMATVVGTTIVTVVAVEEGDG